MRACARIFRRKEGKKEVTKTAECLLERPPEHLTESLPEHLSKGAGARAGKDGPILAGVVFEHGFPYHTEVHEKPGEPVSDR